MPATSTRNTRIRSHRSRIQTINPLLGPLPFSAAPTSEWLGSRHRVRRRAHRACGSSHTVRTGPADALLRCPPSRISLSIRARPKPTTEHRCSHLRSAGLADTVAELTAEKRDCNTIIDLAQLDLRSVDHVTARLQPEPALFWYAVSDEPGRDVTTRAISVRTDADNFCAAPRTLPQDHASNGTDSHPACDDAIGEPLDTRHAVVVELLVKGGQRRPLLL